MAIPLTEPLPIDGAAVVPALVSDAGEILVLQRCCWVEEAILNKTLEIGALHESLDDVRRSLDAWNTWIVRRDGRMIASVRARLETTSWEIGRLMVAPDYSGRGLGRWLLRFIEAQAPNEVMAFALFTGEHSARNITMYERAGFVRSSAPTPPSTVRLEKSRLL